MLSWATGSSASTDVNTRIALSRAARSGTVPLPCRFAFSSWTTMPSCGRACGSCSTAGRHRGRRRGRRRRATASVSRASRSPTSSCSTWSCPAAAVSRLPPTCSRRRRQGADPLDAGRPVATCARRLPPARAATSSRRPRTPSSCRPSARLRAAAGTFIRRSARGSRRRRRGRPPCRRADPLSDREREVLRLLALGHTNQEIAKRLFISVRTAETHRAHIMQKLGLGTRAELVRYALVKGCSKSRDGSPVTTL